MDDERLKNPNQPFGKDYFDEQLKRIRTIRLSERRFYQKLTDIYSQSTFFCIGFKPHSAFSLALPKLLQQAGHLHSLG